MIDQKKDNNLTHFTFSILFANVKREEVEIRPVPSCYDKNQLPRLISTHLIFFGEVHIKQVRGPDKTSQKNEYNNFPQDTKKGKWMWKEVFMTQTINQKGKPSSISKREIFILV